MEKKQAIEILGGTTRAAADAVGVSYHAIRKWPDVLSPRIADRVVAAQARMKKAAKHQPTPTQAEEA